MEKDIKYVNASISLSVSDKIVGCTDVEYTVVCVNYRDQTVHFTDEKTGVTFIRSFSDTSCEFKKSEKSYCHTGDIKVTLGIRGTVSLEVGDWITVGLGRKVKVLFIDYLNERVAITETEVVGAGQSNSLTFEEIIRGNFKKVID